MNLDRIWQRIVADSLRSCSYIHGFTHWARVERNGLYIAAGTDADRTIISLFALLHDIMRVNDGWDPGHGLRAAEYAKSIRGELTALSGDDFNRLIHACAHHTDRTHHEDSTIAACWDADRLELGRVNITPKAEFFNTETAVRIAESGSFDVLEKFEVRDVRKIPLNADLNT